MREIDPAMEGKNPQECFAVRLKRIADQLAHYIDRGVTVREAKPRDWRLRETPWVYSPAVPILFIVAPELAAVIESLGLLAVPMAPRDPDKDAGGKLIRLVSGADVFRIVVEAEDLGKRGPMLRRYASVVGRSHATLAAAALDRSDARRALIATALGVRSDGGGRR